MESEVDRVVDALPGFVWTALPDGQIDLINQSWTAYTGLELDASHGRGWQAAVHPEDLPRLLAGWRGAPAPCAPVETEARLRGSDGRYRWFSFRAHPLADASGQVAKWCGLSIDIDDRIQAEEARRASERRFRLIVDELPVLLSTATPDGELEQANRHYLEYFGATLEELQARETVHGLHPDDRARVLPVRKAAIEAGRPYEIECRRRRSDGIYRWFYLRAFPLRDAEGRIALWYRLQTDIDDRKQAEALLAGEKQLLEMVANGRPLSNILETLCGLVEDTASGCYCSIVLADPGGAKLQEAIAPSLAPEFNEAVRDWPLDRIGGPCVMAARDKVQVIMSDVTSDSRWRNSWRKLAQAHGLRSCWSTPVVSQAGKVLGTFALYRRESGSPNLLQLELIGHFTHIASIAIERAQRDAALRQSEARLADIERELRLTLDSIPTITWRAGPNGYVQQLNKRWFEYTGTTPGQIRGSLWKSCVHPDDLEKLVDVGRAYVAAGVPIDGQARLRRFDGIYRWFLFRPAPARDETGKIIGWYGIITDIEDRKRTEQELQRSEAFLAKGQEASLTGTFSWHSATGKFTWSEQLYRIYEFQPGVPVTFELISTRYHPEDRRVIDGVAEQARSGVTDFDYTHRLLMPDGSVKYIHVVAHGDPGEAGNGHEYFGAVQDVTQRRLAEEALDKVRSELAHVTRVMSFGALTASIAHEVNQPLAGIVTNASTCLRMLAADPPNVEGARETARRTIRDGNRAADVIARLRALFSKKATATEIVDLNEATREVLTLVFSDLLRNRVALRVELDNDRPLLVTGDRVQLQQVILNLVRNASDAMSEVGDRPRSLLVTAAEEEGRARLIVKDAGVGFEPQGAERLFDAFYTTKSGGMGIGLSVSRSIIENHGGELWAETNDGPGATFSFVIPRQTGNVAHDGTGGADWTPNIRSEHDVTRNAEW